MNFTEEHQDKKKLPCPAVKFRGLKSSHVWQGNVPWN